jgi:hypothetical protein
MRVLLLCLVAVVSVWGQAPELPRIVIPGFRAFGPIREYLALTDAQTLKISEQNNEFARWSSVRSQRMYQVQFEIGIETAREPLDPAGLGVRYAEVEAIRREIAERNTKLIAANVAVLTPAQAVKLKALEEALKLVSTGNDAQTLKLLPDSCSTAAAFLLGIPVPTTVIREPYPGGIGYGLGGYCSPRAVIYDPAAL